MNDKSFEFPVDQKSCAGFTLVELIAVIAILAVLAAMLVPALARSQPNVKTAQCQHNLKQLVSAWQNVSLKNITAELCRISTAPPAWLRHLL